MELAYQPIVDLQNGRVTKVEALLRLGDSPEPVSDFVVLCEGSGRIKKLTTEILEIGLSDWRRYGRPGVALSINLSIGNLDEPDLSKRVAKALRQHRYDPRELWFELGERAQEMTNVKRVACMREVAALGVRFTIDSFYDVSQFTLHDLGRLPWSELKIEGELVAAAAENIAKRSQLKAALAIAQQLHLQVTAKSVESAEIATLMTSLGCSHAQGRYFAVPASALTIGSVLDRMNAAAPTARRA